MAMPLLASGGQPQKDAGLPPSAVQPATAPAETLGFADRASRMTVPVSVDGKGPYAFIVDTGAERSVVSRELADTLGLDAGARARLFDFAGSSTVNTVKVVSLTAGSLSTSAIEAPALSAANLGASGMLGIDALQGHRVIVDFDHNRMTLAPAKRHAKGEIVMRAEARLGQLIVTKAWFEGHPIDVVIDTGSWISVGNKAMLALAKRKPRSLGPITTYSVTGRSFDADYVMINDVRIGDIKFDNFGLSFADAPPFARLGLADKPALILGMSSLKMFRRLEMDFVNREIAFTLPRGPINFHDTCRGVANCKTL
ncbi:retroviral-like aspartic protease family protein [Sphingomonas sp.]|uniref:retroviral-like aspartic protease family protein n=1 Tax=Sphingomonas sp. TaxID=28214 RepID=UPI0025CC11BF|nr:retroviral-like aspartic protease family protein [Sphingomonas sp.]